MQKKYNVTRFSFVGEDGERVTLEQNIGFKYFEHSQHAYGYLLNMIKRTICPNPTGLIVTGEYEVVQNETPARECEPKADNVRDYNVGASDYAKHKIQPWDIWLEYKLNPWDADIIKRVLRDKPTDGRKLDYEKIIHICKERIRQLENEE
jgi:hypothetical protein